MDPAKLYAVAGQRATEVVRGMSAEDLSRPTPCSEWNVREVLNHLLNEQLWAPELLRGATIEEVGDRFDGDLLGDDPAGAWEKGYGAAQEAVAAADMSGTVHVSWGDIPTQMYVGQILSDLAVHGWDLARGVGADDTIDAQVVDALLPNIEAEKEALAGSGVYGTPVEVPADADPQTRLLALMGRRRS